MPELKKAKYIWMDGEWVRWDKATVHILTHALHYGDAAFEGIRCYETHDARLAIFRLEDHIARLFNSAKLYDIWPIPYIKKQICAYCKEIIIRNNLQDAYIRPIVYRGYGELGVSALNCPVKVAIAAIPYVSYLGPDAVERGIDVQISPYRRPSRTSAHSMAKVAGLYLNSVLIKHTAIRSGFAEGVALDENGFVAEGSGENIFLIREGVLYTPPVSASILVGLTRDSVITIAKALEIQVQEIPIPIDFLKIADEIFLTGTWAEITPVRSIDKVPIGNGQCGEITKSIRDLFSRIATGTIGTGETEDDYRGVDIASLEQQTTHWLSYVT